MIRRKKKCGKWSSKKCKVGPRKAAPRRRASKCDTGGISHELDKAGFNARWAEIYGGRGAAPNREWAAKAKYHYMLAREDARKGGPSCVARAKKRLAAFRKQYPFVMKAKLSDNP